MTPKRTNRKQKNVSTNSEDAFRLLFLNNPLPMWVYDLKTLAFLEVNDAAIRHYGYTRDEFLAMTIKDIRPPEDVPRLLETVTRAPGELEECGEWRHRLKDRRLIDVGITSRTLVFEGRSARLAVAADVTERKRAEHALRKSERLYRSLFENMLNGYAYCRMLFEDGKPSDFMYLAVNDAFETLTGLKNVVGRKVTEVIPGIRESDPRLFEIYGRVATTGQAERFEMFVEALQMWFWISVYSPAREHFVAVFDVITERKQAEIAIRESEARYRDLVENSQDLICTHDLEGRLLSVNEAAVRLSGYARDRLLGMNLADLLDPKVRNGLGATLAEIRTTGRSRGIMRVRTARGETRYLEYEGGLRSDGVGTSVVHSAARDVTDRVRAEKILQRKTEELERYFTTALDLFCIADTGGHFRRLNKQWEAALGYPLEELEGRRLLDFVHPDDVEATVQAVSRLAGQQDVIDFVNRYRRKDGSYRWIEWRASPAGNLIYAAARDITEHRRAEDGLRESEERFRKVFEGGPLGMVMASTTGGRFLSANAAFCRMLGYTEEELKRLTFVDVTHPDHRGADMEAVKRLWAGQIPRYATEKRYLTKNGDTVWALLTASLIHGQDGKPLYSLAIIEDITERRRAEIELREAQERLQRAAGAGNVGLWDLDLRTNQIHYSPEWKRQIGYEDEEISGSLDDWRTLVHPEDVDRALATLQACLNSPWPAYESEFRVRHKNGSYRLMLARGSLVFDEQGVPVRMLGSRVDITERAQIQAHLNQTQRIESVGRLAGGIAHDFNNLLTVINGIADLGMMKLREGDPQRADLEEIRHAGERAAALTRQLLAFSRRQIMKLDVFAVTSLVANMRDMLQRLIGEDVELVVVSGKARGCVKADRGQLEQVLMNLVVNARDAMPSGGRLTIEVRDVELDEAYAAEHPSMQPGPHVMLAISDTGVGMDEATLIRIFEPFFTTKEPGQGTGLGLSTAYGIVKQSGGSIWVYSEPGKGTTFKIYLPRVEEAALEAPAAQTATPAHGTETVLIVEDEEVVRRLAQRILRSAGYKVLTAANGGEALLLLERRKEPVHLMVTDIVMPGMSGRELAERLSGINPDMKVLYTSGYTDDAIVRHGVLDDATHFVGKPYSTEELRRKVREVLDS